MAIELIVFQKTLHKVLLPPLFAHFLKPRFSFIFLLEHFGTARLMTSNAHGFSFS
jgi:hypothetical protein